MNICIISNGFGEDQIATHLIGPLMTAYPNADLQVFPLVGEGLAYKKLNIIPELNTKSFPSGGFIRSIKDVWSDYQAGVLGSIRQQRRIIKEQLKTSDLTLCVGDVFCLLIGGKSSQGPVVFLPTAKSDMFMKHSWIERNIIKKLARIVFTRDEITANSLTRQGLPAEFLGNPMLDLPEGSHDNMGFSSSEEVLGVLPGSRDEAYGNFKKILKILPLLESKKFVLAKAPTLNIDQLAIDNKLKLTIKNNKSILHNDDLEILVWDCFEDVVNQASYFIGLAGTANEQAVYRGKSVFCFEGTGPQSTEKRFKEQRKLLGERLIFINKRDPSEIAVELLNRIKISPIKPVKWEIISASKNIVDHIQQLISI
jgi:uncharacterized protein (TIGR03492 family)